MYVHGKERLMDALTAIRYHGIRILYKTNAFLFSQCTTAGIDSCDLNSDKRWFDLLVPSNAH